MKRVPELAAMLASKHTDGVAQLGSQLRTHRQHQDLLEKTEELKLNQVVQTKLLSDKLSGLLEDLLEHLQDQKPEIPKAELFTGIDAVIRSVKELGVTLPKEIQQVAKILDKPQENYWTEERLENLLRKVQPKFPDVVIPEPLEEVRVTDHDKVVALLEKIAKKPDFEKTNLTLPPVPEFPEEITVGNLSSIEKYLQDLNESVKKIKTEPKVDVDTSSVVKSVQAVKKSIDELTFPIPSFNMPKDSQGAVPTSSTPFTIKMTEAGSVTYLAKAPIGSAQATAIWQCQKIDETSGVIITWADGNANFDNIATDLTALTYS